MGYLVIVGTKDSVIYYRNNFMSAPITKLSNSPNNEPVKDIITCIYQSVMASLLCVVVESGVYAAAPLTAPWFKVGTIPAIPQCLAGLIVNDNGKIMSLYAGTTSGVYTFDSSAVFINNKPEVGFISKLSIRQHKRNSITVSFKLSQSANVHLDILDCSGKNIVRVFDRYLNSGENTLSLNANKTAKNTCLANGVYLLRLTMGKETVIRRLMFIR
jgi:hypothetical protein